MKHVKTTYYNKETKTFVKEKEATFYFIPKEKAMVYLNNGKQKERVQQKILLKKQGKV